MNMLAHVNWNSASSLYFHLFLLYLRGVGFTIALEEESQEFLVVFLGIRVNSLHCHNFPTSEKLR